MYFIDIVSLYIVFTIVIYFYFYVYDRGAFTQFSELTTSLRITYSFMTERALILVLV